MAPRLRLGALALTVVATLPRSVAAQSRCDADAVPFDSVAASARASLRSIGFDTSSPAPWDTLNARLDTLARKLPSGFTYTREVIAQGSWGVTAKRGQSVATMRDAMPGMNGMMQRVLNTLNRFEVRNAILAANTSGRPPAYETMVCLAREVRLARGLEKLERFERKFGPNSVKLNALEVFVNYGLSLVPSQPLVGVTEDGWPRPWEIVAAYRTTYATLARDSSDSRRTARAVSVAEFGLRHYNFGKGWGDSTANWLARQLKPATWSAGLLVAPEANGALRYPWRGDSRLGAYMAWGGLKVGYLFDGRDKRMIVSREVMVIPYVF
jgi:hypothetical protein